MTMLSEEVERLDALIKDILKEGYTIFSIEEYNLKENTNQSSLSFILHSSKGKTYPIECFESQNGFVDALFKSISSCLSCGNNECLCQIKFESFDVGAKISPKEKEKLDLIDPTKKDAIAKLTVSNQKKERFSFEAKSFSLTMASVCVVIKAIEFFVNAEMAYDTLHKCLKDAKKRAKPYLVEKYVDDMSQIVKISCYSEVAKKYR